MEGVKDLEVTKKGLEVRGSEEPCQGAREAGKEGLAEEGVAAAGTARRCAPHTESCS